MIEDSGLRRTKWEDWLLNCGDLKLPFGCFLLYPHIIKCAYILQLKKSLLQQSERPAALIPSDVLKQVTQ